LERGSIAGNVGKAASTAHSRGLNVEITTGFIGREQALIKLFATTFTASEGPDEGALIGNLVRDLLAVTPIEDIRVFCAEDETNTIGAAIFTRLTYSEDPHIVFLLSPMAVAPGRQRRGIGQALLSHALEALRSEGIHIAITYGDPNFYGRVGFLPITEDQARAPLPLSLPHGWIGQSLTEEQMPVLRGPSTCVSALNRSDVW
jgi:putative acetyltransferase